MNYVEMSEDGELRKEIKDIDTKVSNILTILKGEDTSDEPGGLIYGVSQNTKFRKNIYRLLWIIVSANAGMGLYFLGKVIKILQNGG